jgi:hypothetical protein
MENGIRATPGNNAKSRKERSCGRSILEVIKNKGANLQWFLQRRAAGRMQG